MAREAHEVHHHHYHADGTEMTTAQMENMKREMDVALDSVTWKEGARAGPDVNGKFFCMGPHGWKNYCGP